MRCSARSVYDERAESGPEDRDARELRAVGVQVNARGARRGARHRSLRRSPLPVSWRSRLRGRPRLHGQRRKPDEAKEHGRDLALDLDADRCGIRARLRSQLRLGREHRQRGRLRLARIESELAGVERVEVERLASGEGGLVGERDELAALDEGAADVDRGADDDQEGEAEQEPGDENGAALVLTALSQRAGSWRCLAEEASVAVDWCGGVAAHLDGPDRSEERDAREVDLRPDAGAENAPAAELALERELERLSCLRPGARDGRLRGGLRPPSSEGDCTAARTASRAACSAASRPCSTRAKSGTRKSSGIRTPARRIRPEMSAWPLSERTRERRRAHGAASAVG